MKSYQVELTNHKTSSIVRCYTVFAEDDQTAEEIAYEHLENDECLGYDVDLRPEAWYCSRVTLLETCEGCGGLRMAHLPKGQGAIR